MTLLAVTTVASEPDPVIYDLTELWRLDPDSDDLVFGHIASAVVDADGRTYLLDPQLAQIYVIDARGEHVATLGRPGEGPGEFRYPSSIAWWDDRTLAVAHAMAGRLELIGVNGEPAGTVHFSRDGERRAVPVKRAEPFADVLVVEIASAISDGKMVRLQTELLLCSRDGAELAAVRSFEKTMEVDRFVIDERQDVAPWLGWTVLPGGPLVLRGDHSGYKFLAIDVAGGETVFAERPYQSLRREPALIEAIEQALLADIGQDLANATVVVADTHPDIAGIFTGPDDLLWVRTSRRNVNRPGDCVVVADVHGRDGAWLHTAQMWAAPAAGAGEVFACNGALVLERRRVDSAGRVVKESEVCSDCRAVYVCYRAARRE